MTDTERWVNVTCERIVSARHVRLYRDLYKDLRASLPCAEACRLIEGGLRLTRASYLPVGGRAALYTVVDRARAIAALMRLSRRARWEGRAELEAHNARSVWGK